MAVAIDRSALPQAPVHVIRPNGVALGRGFGASTNAARWTAVKEAIALMAAGDELRLGLGTYDAGSERMTSIPAGCKIIGAGSDKTLFVSTYIHAGNEYNFCNVVTNCLYKGFKVTLNTPGPDYPASAFGLANNNVSDVTGFVLDDIAWDCKIDGFYVSSAAAFALRGELRNCRGESNWDNVYINNTSITNLDLRITNPWLVSTGDPAIRPDGFVTAININAGGGSVKVYGGLCAAYQGNTVSESVLGSGSETIDLFGVELDSTPPVTGGEYHAVGASVRIHPGCKFDPTKILNATLVGAPVQALFAKTPGDVMFDDDVALLMNPKLVNATSATAALAGASGSYGNGTVQYRVWTYKTVAGSRVYSDNYAESNQVTTAIPTNRSVTLTIVTDGTEEGIKIGRTVAGGGYITYQEVSASAGSYNINDTSAGWTSENPIVVTPTYDKRLHINDTVSSTQYGVWSPTLPAWVSEIIAPKTVELLLVPSSTALTTGDGKGGVFFRVPVGMNGWNLTAVALAVNTVSSSGLPTFQVRRVRAGTPADMLSTKVSVDANELDSKDAAAAAVIDAANDDIATGDQIYGDCDIAGTGTTGALLSLTFTKP